jgi:protease-4
MAGGPMPPPPMPPFMMPPFGPWGPPPKRGGGRTVLGILLFFALMGSVLLNLALMGGGGCQGNGPVTVQAGDPKQVVAVIPVKGIIGDDTAEHFAKFFDQIDKDSNVKAVVIHVDTRGGSVTASDQMYHRIERFKTDHSQTPVIVSMGGFATSGGYYLSAHADYIFAEPTTWTGNIGVIAPLYNVSELAAKWGVKETTITAPPNGYKNAASPFAPVTEADKAYLQGLVDVAYKRFVQVVKDGRGKLLKKSMDQLADGRVFAADDALAAGLIDQIGYPDEAFAFAAKKAGLSKPQIVQYHQPPSLLDILGMEGSSSAPVTGKSQGASMTVNGMNVNVNIDVAGALRELSSTRVMYLWQGR